MNDPVALLMTIGTVEVWRSDPTAWNWATFLDAQLGVVVGLGLGWLGRSILGRLAGLAVSSRSPVLPRRARSNGPRCADAAEDADAS